MYSGSLAGTAGPPAFQPPMLPTIVPVPVPPRSTLENHGPPETPPHIPAQSMRIWLNPVSGLVPTGQLTAWSALS